MVGALGVLAVAVGPGCQKTETAVTAEKKADGKKDASSAAIAAGTAGQTEGKPASAQPGALSTGRQVLEAMVAAYRKAATYYDHAVVQLNAEVGGDKIHKEQPFSMAFARPNLLRLEVYQAMVVSDGKEIHAALGDLKDQVLAKPAPAHLTWPSLFTDPVLGQALGDGIAGAPVQGLLLLDDNAMVALTRGAEEPQLGPSAMFGEHDCYRVSLRRREGTAVFWIDKSGFELRRVEYPVDELAQNMAEEGKKVENVSLIAEFPQAQLGREIEPAAFRFEVPDGARLVKFFIPAEPGQLLGKKVPDFRFTDVKGQAVTPESLAGKVAVLDFWATWCDQCRKTLPLIDKDYARLKNNPRVAFYAVSIDPKEMKVASVAAAYEKLKVGMPLLCDTEGRAGALFMVPPVPMTYIIGPNGLVQDFHAGQNPDMPSEVGEKVEKLLAGKDLYPDGVKEYQEHLKQFGDAAASAEEALAAGSAQRPVTAPKPQIAPATPPAKLRLKSLWTCTKVEGPGNVLIVNGPAGPRIFVIDQWKAVVELDASGKIAARHDLDVPKTEALTFLRTTVDARGRRYYAASGGNMQQIHLYDENWKLLTHFPANALENRHAGIADAQLGDLEGNGQPKLYVGYWESVGVQGVSLEGKRLWSNQSLEYALRLAVGGPPGGGPPGGGPQGGGPQGGGSKGPGQARLLLAINGRQGSVVLLDAHGERQGEVTLRDWPLKWIAAANLEGPGQPNLLGISGRQAAGVISDVAVGFNLRGEELWHYVLPKGAPAEMIEPAVAGRVTTTGPESWIMPGVDGSIHILAPNGQLIDRFNYGASLKGLGTCQIAGRPVLVVASGKGVEAMEAE